MATAVEGAHKGDRLARPVCRSLDNYVRSGPVALPRRTTCLNPFEYLMIFDSGGYTLGSPRCVGLAKGDGKLVLVQLERFATTRPRERGSALGGSEV